MIAIHLITLLALAQYLVFGTLVGQARGRYKIEAPAVSGHEVFERYYRVQMNTLELLVVFVPALWLAALDWSATAAAIAGAVYLVGRTVYAISYVRAPASRTLGFMLSMVPIGCLLVGAVVGLLRSA